MSKSVNVEIDGLL